MRLFLDTANIDEVCRWAKTGLLDGVTTNPTSLSQEEGDPKELIKRLCDCCPGGAISVEVTKEDPEDVYEQALEIAAVHDQVVVKVPCCMEYCSVIARLVGQGVSVNVTLVFSLLQACCMAKLGVAYVSPFMGRLDDIGADGVALVRDIRAVYDAYGYETSVLAASVRSVSHVTQAAYAGADVVTMKAEHFRGLLNHPLTDRGLQQFLEDWHSRNTPDQKRSLFS